MTTGRLVGGRLADRTATFLAGLDAAQAAVVRPPRTPGTLRRWTNLPQATLGRGERRRGLATSTLSEPQWTDLFAVLGTALDPAPGRGLDRIRGHLAADDLLRAEGGVYGYGHGEFVVAVLGDPDGTDPWTLQFGGHHLAVSLTWADGRLVGATPSFRGIEPFDVVPTGRGVPDPERRSWDALVALLASLDATQRTAARLQHPRSDLLLGPGRDWCFLQHSEGLPASRLDTSQRSLLLDAVTTFVDDLVDADAERVLAGYNADLDATHVGWTGSTRLTAPGDLVRIDGPQVWIELSMQDGINQPGPHPHAVWRDRVSDYGGTR